MKQDQLGDFKTPTVANLEITELCNVKCKHCYNPWRDESMGVNAFDMLKIKKIIKELKKSGVFHVILSGGEPFSNFEVLKAAMKLLKENNISFSCNTNLILANDENTAVLKELGMEHCLTSIPSINPDENDDIMQSKGSLKKIINGIKSCVKNGIRVSANMVVTRSNKHRVYETGKIMAELGCTKFFITRAVPPIYSSISKDNKEERNELLLSQEEVKKSLDDGIRVRDEFGIAIGSLISYPLCFLSDLEKYSDFVGRGCPSQRGHIVNINSNGEIHTCVHEEESYGSIWKTSLAEVYNKNMIKWRDGSMHYEECKSCPYLKVCQSGCQMTANAVNGAPASKDPLFAGKENIKKHFDLVTDNKIYDYIQDSGKFYVPKRVRFRNDEKFIAVNSRWGNTFKISNEIGIFLQNKQNKNEKFTLKDFGIDRETWLANLYFKEVIDTEVELDINRIKIGLSADLSDLPHLNEKSEITA